MTTAPSPDLETPGTGPARRGAQTWRPFLATPLGLSTAYASVGLLWILLSDRLLQSVVPDVATLTVLSQGKGVAFVLATSALLYVLSVRWCRASGSA